MKIARTLIILAIICTPLLAGLSCNGSEAKPTPTPTSIATSIPTSTPIPTPTPTPTPTPMQYSLTITSSPSSGGTATRNDNGPYYYDDVVQITASPNNYYEFDYWSGDVNGNQITKSITITKNTHVTAYFELKDSDNDGISDKEEDEIGSNPYVQDTDADGILDDTDLWPTKDAKVRVNITGFTQLSYCDPLSDWGEPYCIIKVDGLSQLQLSGSTGSVDFNIPDNVRYVSVHVEAWDSDPTSTDDPYDISSEAGINDIDITFDRESSPSIVTGDGSEDGNLNDACQATIRIQITNY